MHRGTITFLFDTSQYFQEPWEMAASSAEDALKRLTRIAQARVALLASNIRIVQLKVAGQPVQRVQWKGQGGNFAWPRCFLVLRRNLRSTKKNLRGVPKEIFDRNGLTTLGTGVFASFNKTLFECGCMIEQDGVVQPIGRLEPIRQSLHSYRKDKKATKRKMMQILGQEEGEKFWKELRKRSERPAAVSP